MFGFPNDTVKGCKKTIEYAQALNTYGAQFSVFTPYPGTPAYNDYRDKVTTEQVRRFHPVATGI